jgi:hypothetical protein
MCRAPDRLGRSVCSELHKNLQERLTFVKEKLEKGKEEEMKKTEN